MNTMKKAELYDMLNQTANKAIAHFSGISHDFSPEDVVIGVILELKYIVEDNYRDDALFSKDDVKDIIDKMGNERELTLRSDLVRLEYSRKALDYLSQKINEAFENKKAKSANSHERD